MTDRLAVGCIADDVTGATDVAAAFRRSGLRTVLRFGVPRADATLPPADAVVVALKSRTAPAATAVSESLSVLDWLEARAAERVYFKYCSTFDSTARGNIGPVADALLDATDTPITIVCPAAPEHGRTVYRGHLFVGDVLLSESSMRDHPLTPMRDADLVRVLAAQTPQRVGLIALPDVSAGPARIRARLDELAADGVRFAVADATDDADLAALAMVASDLRVATGAAGLARALGRVLAGRAAGDAEPAVTQLPGGRTVILAGSSSAATLEQVRLAADQMPSFRLDVRRAADATTLAAEAIAWLDARDGSGPLLFYASAPPAERPEIDSATAAALERALAKVARHALERGVRRLVVAGGETSGAVVGELGIAAVEVALEEAVGVPWLVTGDGLALLLKSGNFGVPDLFVRAAARVAA